VTKKILQVVTQMEAGGAQRIALWLNDAFAKDGDDSQLWFIYLKREIHANGVTKTFAKQRPKGVYAWLATVRDIFADLRSSKPDVIITHTYYSNILVQPLALLLGIKIRIAVHHNPLDTYPRIAKLLDTLLGSTGVYTKNVVVSDTVLKSAMSHNRFYRKTLLKITNGLPANKIAASQVPSREIRRQLGIADGATFLVNAGRISMVKNQIFLLGIIARVPGAILGLIGDGELFQEVKDEAVRLNVGNRVIFLGEVPYEYAVNVIASADIFLFPSIYESMGLALVEAMILNRPIIASNIEATNEFLGDCGILLDLQQDKWVEAVEYLVKNPEQRALLGAKAGEKAANYDINLMVTKYRSLFQ
jgi:glycosyltransferase involved in cell wall biosynthesis